MIGKIERTSRSKSGKTLGVMIGGTWYITKEWEMEGMVGESIDFTPKIDTFQGKPQRWINEYFLAGDVPPTTAPQAAPTSRMPPPPAPVGRDADVALLHFVGLQIAGRLPSEWEEVGRKAYQFGTSILSGRMDAVSTAAPPEHEDHNQDSGFDDEFDDDIPF